MDPIAALIWPDSRPFPLRTALLFETALYWIEALDWPFAYLMETLP